MASPGGGATTTLVWRLGSRTTRPAGASGVAGETLSGPGWSAQAGGCAVPSPIFTVTVQASPHGS